ncbi:hypothetical protein EPO66_04200, partial [bacterium]
MKERRINEIKGIVLVAVGLIVLASLISFNPYDLKFYTSHPNFPPKNFIRTFGAYLSGLLLFLFGWTSYVIPAFVFWLGVNFFKQQPVLLRWPRLLGIIGLLLSLGSLIGILPLVNDTAIFSRAGFFGFTIARVVSNYFGRLGAYILFSTLVLLFFALVTEILISTFFIWVANKAKALFAFLGKFAVKKEKKKVTQTLSEPKPKINVAN